MPECKNKFDSSQIYDRRFAATQLFREGERINKPELRIANALLARAYTKIAATQLIRRYAANPPLRGYHPTNKPLQSSKKPQSGATRLASCKQRVSDAQREVRISHDPSPRSRIAATPRLTKTAAEQQEAA